MLLTRREFLKTSAATAGVAVAGMGFVLTPVQAHAQELRKNLAEATRTTSICPYCGVGCGFEVHTADGAVINIEGDADHPINQGTACSKGSSLYQMANNDNRLMTVMYRAPGASDWEEMDYDTAIQMVAEKIKATRDATFETENSEGAVVNRTLGMGSLGSAALDNEECWLYQKLLRALGLVYIEHQARN
jgi:formate dehydrogenase major subunit